MSFLQPEKIINYFLKIDAYVRENNQMLWQKYVQLGSRTVRLLCYSKDFIPLIEKQLSYVLKDKSENYDATIVLWNVQDIPTLILAVIDNHSRSRIRIEQLVLKTSEVSFEMNEQISSDCKIITKISANKSAINSFEILNESYSKHNAVLRMNATSGIVYGYDEKNKTYFYGVKDLHPEEFIKQGHIFVQIFNRIVKTPNTNLVHGAAIGLNKQGVLLCARGQRGKSTLAVLAMMQGFEYVSDDYLILEKEGDEIYSYPIYSIITLSPKMYNELYDDLKGRFVSNNARRDKYVIDIKAYHDSFCEKYPIKVCVFPQIVKDEKPTIVPCKKGRAITQLVHSTIIQMEDKHDIKTIRKLISFIKDFEFYQINLCADIKANVECLRQFCETIKSRNNGDL